MNIVVVTDIFGLTEHVMDLAETVRPAGGSVQIVDPYKGVSHAFKDESEAYAYFADHAGLEAYARYLTEVISSVDGDCLVVGFSVGASAAWVTASSYIGKNLRGIIGFYGSQIRHHSDLKPLCPAALLFPKSEEHFDVQALAARLEGKDGLECIRTDYLHGFMNPLSRNFDETGHAKYLSWLAERINSLAG